MPSEIPNSTDPSATSLVGGIIDDMQSLVKQQVQMTRKEIVEEVHKASAAAQLYAVGGGIMLLGFVFAGMSAVHLLHWTSTSPLSDPGKLPLWACHAIVAGPIVLIGVIITWLARRKVDSIHPFHNPATVAMKENVKWATNTN